MARIAIFTQGGVRIEVLRADGSNIPSARKRRMRAPKPPMGVSLRYAALLRTWLASMYNAVLDQLDGWNAYQEQKQGAAFLSRVKADALDLSAIMPNVRLQLEETLDPAKMSPHLTKFAAKVSDQGRDEFKRVIGIPTHDIGVRTLIEGFRERNVSLIKSLAGQQLNDISQLLSEADAGAWRVETLRAKIQESFSVTKSKADLLARDQVLKLNGQITKTRHQNAGILEYIWTTSGDERVRDSHVKLDGTRQKWAVPPVVSEDGRTGHPGDDYQCRCTAFPILPELDEPLEA